LVIDDSDDATNSTALAKQQPAPATTDGRHAVEEGEEEEEDDAGGPGALVTALAFETVHQARLLEQCQARLAVLPDRIASQLLFNGDGAGEGMLGRPQRKRSRASLDEVRACVGRDRLGRSDNEATGRGIPSNAHNPAHIQIQIHNRTTPRPPLRPHSPPPPSTPSASRAAPSCPPARAASGTRPHTHRRRGPPCSRGGSQSTSWSGRRAG
jgi:hypothetical protein